MHTKLNKIKNEIKTRSLEWLTVCYCHFFFNQKGMVTVLVKKDVSVLMFPVLQWCYKRDVEITILSFVNKAQVMFLLTFKSDGNCIFMFKTNKETEKFAWNIPFARILNQCKCKKTRYRLCFQNIATHIAIKWYHSKIS